ncbi:SEC-C motif protein [Komagataeibacter saccharivorans]|uniref:SEC-C motif protein n=1 Tax=Komagataeibacter saccharivorans TaxID=265959 RepID=A0A347WEJ3_9PROT|nr:SEC-C domain-containing protein [Komagataeibacter saccharivorans]AXY23286.1 SEC-C motif protein [Komagataeibacter saccharivorans]
MHNRVVMKGRDRNKPCWCGSGQKYKKCHLNREDQERENPWNAVQAHRKAFQKKACWARDVGLGQCHGTIIRAHTVSKGPNLSRIANNGHVLHYSATASDFKKTGGKLGFKSIGIKDASVFSGFCAHHDRTLFSCIENEPYSGRADQNLTVAYRTLSRELFGKDATSELRTILRNADKGQDLQAQIMLQTAIQCLDQVNEAARRELRATYQAITNALVHENFGVLRSLVIEFNGRLPFMFAGAWSPFYDLHGEPLQSGYADELLQQIFFSSFVGSPRDFICVSWLDTPDAPGKVIADQIDVLSGDQKANLCLQFVVKHVENIFFNPIWFHGLNQEQRGLLESLAFSGCDNLGAPPTVVLRPDIEFALPQATNSRWV